MRAETSNAQLAKEIAELRAQIRSLKGAVVQTRKETRSTREKVGVITERGTGYSLPAPGPILPVGAVPAFVTADKKLQFGALTITPGGFVEGTGIFRSRATQSDLQSNYAIPFNNNTLGQTNEFKFSARQTRAALLVEAPITPTFLAAGYVETDFLGGQASANYNQTDGYGLRIRNLYATADLLDYGVHVLAGQNWTLLTLNSKGITPRNELLPPTIDASQNVGSLYARQPGIRLVKDFDKKLWLALALEESQTTGCPTPNLGASGTTTVLNPTGTQVINGRTVTCDAVGTGGSFTGAGDAGPAFSLNHVPDVIGKAAYEAKFADRDVHLEVEGIYTDLYDRVLGTNGHFSNKDTTGYGVGAGLIAPLIPKVLDFQVNGLYGRGINRYGPAGLPNATFNSDGSFRPLQGYIALTGLTLHATPSIDIYGFAGVEGETRSFTKSNLTGAATYVGIGSPTTVNTGCGVEGLGTCNGATKNIFEITGGFWDKLYKGSYGEVRAGIQYSYLNREIFSAPGLGTQRTSDHFTFTSLRYYPFQ